VEPIPFATYAESMPLRKRPFTDGGVALEPCRSLRFATYADLNRENAHSCESRDGKLREECLNLEIFASLLEAQVIIESWRVYYNEARPHQSLDYKTPCEFLEIYRQGVDGMNDKVRKDLSEGDPLVTEVLAQRVPS
jgi:hypothetical protein